ncbi:MAG: type II toxin-antitoxin system VapC family toxin [Acaryochloridaceae cyanobacterium RU_4_10]|nr:type II toxin-antitoxin system VapC family toxin [Acaryochloridaceae cyanobacterium RU_4_10]
MVVDTHALIWFLEGNPRLGAIAKAVLMDPVSELVLPAIALAEAVWIVDRGKTSIPSVRSLLDSIAQDARVVLYPLDLGIIAQSMDLSSINEMHDRQIVATAKVLETQGKRVALLTCDRNITASNLVAIVW